MGSHPPELPIEVDDATGVWLSDALPMLYVPRHFFVNNHKAIEAALGVERYAALLYDAGYRSAWHWCDKEAAHHGLAGAAVFEHYLRRLSQRGWGWFTVESLDVERGEARVRLDHSAFVYEYGECGEKVDYMFTGWFAGAMDWIAESRGSALRTRSVQRQSAAEPGCEYGIFEVSPLGDRS